MNKRNHIILATSSLDYDCYALSETWLHSSHNDNEFFCDKYTIFRRDREFSSISDRRGGGVLIAVKKEFECKLIELPEIKPLEAICVRITMKSGQYTSINYANSYIYIAYIFSINVQILRPMNYVTCIWHISILLLK